MGVEGEAGGKVGLRELEHAAGSRLLETGVFLLVTFKSQFGNIEVDHIQGAALTGLPFKSEDG